MKAIRAMVLAGLAVCIVPTGTAHAQFRPWPQYGSWWGHHAPARHKHRHRHKNPQALKQEPARVANGPLQIIVSIADQRVSVYDNGALIARSAASTGVPRHPTPLGVFGVIGKKRWHRSNLYSAAPMPFMQRITWSGIALHAGVVPGHPASHGCIRLKEDFAVRLWHLTGLGTRVIIVPNDVQPVEIANPRLFASKQNAAFDPPEPRAAIADDPLMTVAANPNADAQHVAALEAQGSSRAAVAPRKVAPISVFVSRKSSRLYVRQGFAPVFDIPVTIQDPEQPLGTHVFTAVGLRTDPALRWTVTSMPENSPRAPEAVKQRTPGRQIAQGTPPSPDKANAALDRIEIPQHVVEHISQRLTPGASLIVSDHGISPETGNGTDFIVVTR